MPLIRIVADANTVISGLFWHGSPRKVLDLARQGTITLFTSPILLAELEDVLERQKLSKWLREARATAHELVIGYAALAIVIHAKKYSARYSE